MGFTANYVISIQKGTRREGTLRGLLPSHSRLMRCYRGRVAQLVEQVTFNHWVTGSNPVALTIAPASAPAFSSGIKTAGIRCPRPRDATVGFVLSGLLEKKSANAMRWNNGYWAKGPGGVAKQRKQGTGLLGTKRSTGGQNQYSFFCRIMYIMCIF